MTTPVPIPKLLKEYLEDLNEKALKEFQWHLWQIQVKGSRPIPKSKLEYATRVSTVDKLVEVFGEEGAVEWTVETFFRMNLNGLASKLVQAKVDQSREQREEESETSSAREKPREVDPNILKDLTCSICLSLFTDPVVLQCGHSFCQTCVHKDWDRNIIRECSLCKQFIPEGDPPINFSLKNLCENYRGRIQAEPSGHRNHTETFQFQTPPKNIREKQEVLKEAKKLCDSSIERIKTQSFNTEKEIKEVFKRLHASLDEEEKTRRAALREEARQKISVIHSMHVKFKSKLGPGKRFIRDCKPEMERMRRALRNLKIETNFSKHLEKLQLKVLKKMSNDTEKAGADTGHEKKHWSGLTGLHMMNVKRQLFPGNLECSTHCEQNQERNLKRRRVEHDSENGNVSVHDPDNNTSIPTQSLAQSVDDFSDDIPPISPASSEELHYDDCDIMHVPTVDISHIYRHEVSLSLEDFDLQVQ